MTGLTLRQTHTNVTKTMNTRLTDDCEDAGGFSGSGVALVLGLVVKDRLMDDEDPLDALGDYLIFLTFPDLTAVPEPFNLKEQRMEGSIEEPGRGQCDKRRQNKQSLAPWQSHETLHIQTWQIPSLSPPHPARAS